MDNFISRMVDESPFHGGERPDAADFRVKFYIFHILIGIFMDS
jgi:hypothetical protein